MNRIVSWLKSIFSRPQATVRTDPPKTAEIVTEDEKDPTVELSLGAKVASWMDKHGTGEDAAMQDNCSEDYEATVPDLKVLDPGRMDEDSNGFDPHDTADTDKE